MSSLLLAALIGTGFAILATQNTLSTTVHLAGYTWTGIPLYVVAIASLLVGLFLTWLLSLVNWATSSLTLRGKEVRAQKAETAITHLQQQIRDLEARNSELETELEQKDEQIKINNPSPLQKFTHSLSR